MSEKRPVEELARLLDGIPVAVGLQQQGHMDTVEKMILAGASWEQIGREIGWYGPTARDWFVVEAARKLQRWATNHASGAGSPSEMIRLIERIASLEQQLSALKESHAELIRYAELGVHARNCASRFWSSHVDSEPGQCDCGLDAALARAREAQK